MGRGQAARSTVPASLPRACCRVPADSSAREEPGLVEDLLGAEQVIDGAAQLGRQDAERLAGAVLFVHPRLPALGPGAGPQVQARRRAQGPAQMFFDLP